MFHCFTGAYRIRTLSRARRQFFWHRDLPLATELQLAAQACPLTECSSRPTALPRTCSISRQTKPAGQRCDRGTAIADLRNESALDVAACLSKHSQRVWSHMIDSQGLSVAALQSPLQSRVAALAFLFSAGDEGDVASTLSTVAVEQPTTTRSSEDPLGQPGLANLISVTTPPSGEPSSPCPTRIAHFEGLHHLITASKRMMCCSRR